MEKSLLPLSPPGSHENYIKMLFFHHNSFAQPQKPFSLKSVARVQGLSVNILAIGSGVSRLSSAQKPPCDLDISQPQCLHPSTGDFLSPLGILLLHPQQGWVGRTFICEDKMLALKKMGFKLISKVSF